MTCCICGQQGGRRGVSTRCMCKALGVRFLQLWRHTYVYMYCYITQPTGENSGQLYRRRGGVSNREIVSCGAGVRAQSVSLMRSRPQIGGPPPPSLFPFAPRAFPFSLVGLNGLKWNWMTSNEISWNEIEIKRDQVKPHEVKWSQVKSNEISWNLMEWHEIVWNQLKSS